MLEFRLMLECFFSLRMEFFVVSGHGSQHHRINIILSLWIVMCRVHSASSQIDANASRKLIEYPEMIGIYNENH